MRAQPTVVSGLYPRYNLFSSLLQVLDIYKLGVLFASSKNLVAKPGAAFSLRQAAHRDPAAFTTIPLLLPWAGRGDHGKHTGAVFQPYSRLHYSGIQFYHGEAAGSIDRIAADSGSGRAVLRAKTDKIALCQPPLHGTVPVLGGGWRALPI